MRQIESAGLSKEAFLKPPDDTTDLVAEGMMNRVLRAAEEAGRIDEGVAEQYGFSTSLGNLGCPVVLVAARIDCLR